MKKFLLGLFILSIVLLGAAATGGYVFIFKPYLEVPVSSTRLQRLMAPENTFLLHNMNLVQYKAIDTYFLENENPDYKYPPEFEVLKFLKKSGLNIKKQATALVASVLIPKSKIVAAPKLNLGLSGSFNPKKLIAKLSKKTIVKKKEYKGTVYYEYTFINKLDCKETGPFSLYITKDTIINTSPEQIEFWIDRAITQDNLETADLTQFNDFQKYQLVTTQLIGLKKMISIMDKNPQLKKMAKTKELLKLETVFLTAGIDPKKQGLALNMYLKAKNIDEWKNKSLALKQKANKNSKNFKESFPGFYGVIDAFYSDFENNSLKMGVVINEKMIKNLKLLPDESLFFALSGFDPSKAKASPELAKKATEIIDEIVDEKEVFSFKQNMNISDFGSAKKLQYDNIPIWQYQKNNIGITIDGIEVVNSEENESQLLYKILLKMKNDIDYPHMEDLAKVYIEDTIGLNDESLASDFHCGEKHLANPIKYRYSEGRKEVLIKANTAEDQLKKISGRIEYRVPSLLKQLRLTKTNINNEKSIGGNAKFTLKKLSNDEVVYTVMGDKTRIYKVRALNKENKQLKESRYSGFRVIPSKDPEKTVKYELKFKGIIETVEVTYIDRFKKFNENFVLPPYISNLKERVKNENSKLSTYSFDEYKKSFSEKKKVIKYIIVKSRKRKRSRKKKVIEYVNQWKPLPATTFKKHGQKIVVNGVEVYLTSMGSFHVSPKFELRLPVIAELSGNTNAVGIEVHEVTMKDGVTYRIPLAEEYLKKDDFGRSEIRGSFGEPVSWKKSGELKPGFFVKSVFESKLTLDLGRQNLKPDNVESIKASLYFNFPREVKTLSLESLNLNTKVGEEGFGVELVKKSKGKYFFRVTGDFNHLLALKAYNIDRKPLAFSLGQETLSKKDTEILYTVEVKGKPVKFDFDYALEFEEKSFPLPIKLGN